MKRDFLRLIYRVVLILVVSALTASQVTAKWMMPTLLPVTRLLQNVAEYIKAHPKEAEGYYTIGRINSAAFATEAEALSVYKGQDGKLPRFPGFESQVHPRTSDKTLASKSLTYLTEALRNYKKATELDPNSALAFLGLGFECEEALRLPELQKTAMKALGLAKKSEPETLRQQALQSYRKAYALTIKTELKADSWMLKSTSQEAGEGILRLQKDKTLTAQEEKERDSLQANLKKLESRPRMVTPILISFRATASLSDLLASDKPDRQVRFDLDGTGRVQSWPWVKPTTGILVWDPQHTGKITSGLQLFGSVTWWIFWKNGYEPLAALDNDHNGWLEGKELNGICVWFDRNGNGVCDPGEVVSLKACGIQRIAVHAGGQEAGAPCNLTGVQLTDGSYTASFDWTPTARTLHIPKSAR